MGTRALEQIFTPDSIAVVGASEREGSLGGAVLRNILESEFRGQVYPVNARGYKTVEGLKAYGRLSSVKERIDLAIICTPASTIKKVLSSLTRAKVPAAIIMTGGAARGRSSRFLPSAAALSKAQKETGIRILGPDCLGVVNPHHNLNASSLHIRVKKGKLAYAGQSGALANAIADWATSRNIGFSHLLTLGQGQDITLSDSIDYLASDRKARTLLIHLDDFHEGRRLIRSLRAASRNKLVLAVKSNRFASSPLGDAIETPGILNRDMLIDHALQRAGVLRVAGTHELFDCVDTLQQPHQVKGERLAIVTNSQGGAILAIDRLLHDKGRLASLDEECCDKLRKILPDYTEAMNPVLLDPELRPKHLKDVLRILLSASSVDAVLMVYTPGLGADPLANAKALADVAAITNKAIFSCWMGEASIHEAREYLDQQELPNFDTPDNAIKAFMYRVRHLRTQELMRETPESIETLGAFSEALYQALPDNDVLLPDQAWDLVRSYGFPVAENSFYAKAHELAEYCTDTEAPWVVKVHHREYLRPFAYGQNARQRWRSVGLNINNRDQLLEEVDRLETELQDRFPESEVLGYSIQPMYRAVDNLQISFGIGRDTEIGPFIFFGGGGSTADILTDRQVALPPLNAALAKHLVKRSHVASVLEEKTDNYDAEIAQLSRWLVAISQIAIQYPVISGLELNAIRRDQGQYLVLGVAGETGPAEIPAIRPYPVELEQNVRNKHGKLFFIRPIKAEDEMALDAFHRKLSPDTLRFRFFTTRKRFNHTELARFSQIDYDREMAFVTFSDDELAGVVRVWVDPDNITAEFSVLIGDHFAGQQLGSLLMTRMIEYLKDDRGVLQLLGTVLPNNRPMLTLARRLGFSERENTSEGVVEIVLDLNNPRQEWQKKRMYLL